MRQTASAVPEKNTCFWINPKISFSKQTPFFQVMNVPKLTGTIAEYVTNEGKEAAAKRRSTTKH